MSDATKRSKSSPSPSASSSVVEPQQKKRRTSSTGPTQQLTTLPLMLPKKSSENTVLVQLNNQELDMKGDAGTIGRLRVKDGRIELEMNGKKFHGQTFPSVTCMVVAISKTEARESFRRRRCEKNVFIFFIIFISINFTII